MVQTFFRIAVERTQGTQNNVSKKTDFFLLSLPSAIFHTSCCVCHRGRGGADVFFPPDLPAFPAVRFREAEGPSHATLPPRRILWQLSVFVFHAGSGCPAWDALLLGGALCSLGERSALSWGTGCSTHPPTKLRHRQLHHTRRRPKCRV